MDTIDLARLIGDEVEIHRQGIVAAGGITVDQIADSRGPLRPTNSVIWGEFWRLFGSASVSCGSSTSRSSSARSMLRSPFSPKSLSSKRLRVPTVAATRIPSLPLRCSVLSRISFRSDPSLTKTPELPLPRSMPNYPPDVLPCKVLASPVI